SNEVSADAAPWIRQKTSTGDTIIGARAILNQGLEMADAVFFILDQQGNIVERKDAARAYLRDGYWELQDVKIFRNGTIQPVANDRVPTNLKPEFVQERLARPETIPFYDLPGKIEVARSFGLKANAFAMQFDS
ncbi:LptF/LptG family permease, partial [bacterium M00.F.Ca.ET.227.01.1.1]